jgi:hypothetical protein
MQFNSFVSELNQNTRNKRALRNEIIRANDGHYDRVNSLKERALIWLSQIVIWFNFGFQAGEWKFSCVNSRKNYVKTTSRWCERKENPIFPAKQLSSGNKHDRC